MSDHADAMRTLAAAIPYATAVLVVGVNPDRPGESDLTIVSMRGANCMCGTCMDIVPDAAIAALLRQAADEYDRLSQTPDAAPYPASGYRGPAGDGGPATNPH